MWYFKICLDILGFGIFQKQVFNSILSEFQLDNFNMVDKILSLVITG